MVPHWRKMFPPRETQWVPKTRFVRTGHLTKQLKSIKLELTATDKYLDVASEVVNPPLSEERPRRRRKNALWPSKSLHSASRRWSDSCPHRPILVPPLHGKSCSYRLPDGSGLRLCALPRAEPGLELGAAFVGCPVSGGSMPENVFQIESRAAFDE